MRLLLLLLVLASELAAQDRQVDPTWLRRYVPQVGEARVDFTSATCHYKPIFGEADTENRIMRSVARFGEVTLDAQGKCQAVLYDHQEEIYFILGGKAVLHYGDQTYAMRANDFTYLAPGVKHSIENASQQSLRVLVMGFKIPPSIAICAPPEPKIVNMDDMKEETVEGHPTSVLYKLLVGPRTGTRDAIDQAYVVISSVLDGFRAGRYEFSAPS